MTKYLSYREVSFYTGLTEKTLRNWVKSGDLSKPKKCKGLVIGWNLDHLETHKWLQHHFNQPIQDRAAEAPPSKKSKGLYRKGHFNGVPINCAIKRPSIKAILSRLLPQIKAASKKHQLMIGLAITLLDPKRATKLIQHIKAKLVKRLGVSKKEIYHWRKNEFGMVNGEHSHVIILIGFDSPPMALEEAKRVIHDTIQRMGLTVYLDTTRKLKTKGVHIIHDRTTLEHFIYHASYLAKKRTAKTGKRDFSYSINVPNDT
ncbi:helix-turn-helix transcriptional regulator [Vibrio splendidus]|uniref:helix-turn-helix transcriptional regulator n=1 Tax=Vibrio splendidus TaxID=29497 RepID=UPI000301E762|nr:hypothetical protein [Vibrio splendidus]OEF17526.1 hypothetical protein A145_16085 [Vibrio splendidus 5S-101]PTP40461.1 hypothetical protein CWN83_23860 [Vibrio splendidus]PTP76049.1 hypothetical protein CWO06_11125 [Vibrio splendidus]